MNGKSTTQQAPEPKKRKRKLGGRELDPEWLHERGVMAAAARNSPKAHIEALIRQAGKLTPADIARLRTLLPAPAAEADQRAAS